MNSSRHRTVLLYADTATFHNRDMGMRGRHAIEEGLAGELRDDGPDPGGLDRVLPARDDREEHDVENHLSPPELTGPDLSKKTLCFHPS